MKNTTPILMIAFVATAFGSPFTSPIGPDSQAGDTIVTDARVEAVLASMTLKERVGQLFIVDLRDERGELVQQIGAGIRSMLSAVAPSGILLFGANIVTIEQTVTLIEDLQSASELPLIIAVDYEGGRVSRLTSSGKIPATNLPPSATIGASGDPMVAYRIGRIMGAELGSLGVNMNLAPVADIFLHPESMIGDRSFSDDPLVVAEMTAAMVRGLQEEGVSAVVKHFPGHGATTTDSHDTLAVLDHGRRRLESVEFLPFVSAVEAGVDGVMTAHVAVPAISGDMTPTTFSRKLISDELRTRIGHSGLIMTDSLAMGAIREEWDSGDSAVRAIDAGADVILHPFDIEGAANAVVDAVRSGSLTLERIDQSVRRVLRTKLRRGLDRENDVDPHAVLGAEAHTRFVESIVEAAGAVE